MDEKSSGIAFDDELVGIEVNDELGTGLGLA